MICDNKGALASSFGYKHINPRWACYDLLCMIRFHLANSTLKWRHRHIKGHQDDNRKYDDLDIISQANVDVDILAKEELNRDREVSDEQVLLGQCWRIKNVTNGEYIQGNIESALRRLIYEDIMKDIWGNKLSIRRTIKPDEWLLLQKVNTAHLEWEHFFSIKYLSGILPTKVNMVQRKHAEDPTCPCCEEIENTEHILQCQSVTQGETFTRESVNLTNYLLDVTSWEVRGAIIELLEAYREQRDILYHCNWNDMVTLAITKQYDMGPRAFFGGIWTQEWITEQDNFHKTLKTKKKGTTVVAEIIRKVQKVVRELWYNRNDELHMNEQSRINKEKSNEINTQIDILLRRKRLIPLGHLAPADRKYFKRKTQNLKRMRNNRKERWAKDAEAILDKYDTENNSAQVRAFRSYFMHRDDG